MVTMQLIFKSNDVKNPGSRGGHWWRDEHGVVRYGERPAGKPHEYIVAITLSDRAKPVYIKPDPSDYENGQLSQAKIRAIVNRELFGEYGWKDGKFWQKKGLLVEYKPRTTAGGKVVVDEIQRSGGYVSFEFRDSSIERAYGKGLPQKIMQFATTAKDIDPTTGETARTLPEKPDDAPIEGTADIPVDEMGIRNIPKQKPMTEVALDAPLKEHEDPVSLANWYLQIFLQARKPSQAKTPEGQAKARAERKGQFDLAVGARQAGGFTPYVEKESFNREPKGLPAWIVNKYDSPEHLQHELGRANEMEWLETSHVDGRSFTRKKHAAGGRPLTALITFGLWNPENKEKRVREQLEKEWRPFIRRWARKYANVYASTDAYHKFVGAGSGNQFMRERERDLYNQGIAVLLHEANNYKSNDEIGTINSRFDRVAENAIKNEMRRMSKEQALDLGATALEDLSEEESYHTPKTISPREYFELRHLEPLAHDILSEAMAGLPTHMRAAFESRMWIDDYRHDPSMSEERKFNEARARQAEKHGESRLHWGRPLIGEGGKVTSVATKLADEIVTLRGGEKKRLGELYPQKQRYYLDQWFNDAVAHISEHLKTKDGKLSPNGRLVEKWLRLEQKLAHINRKDIETRAELPVRTMKMPKLYVQSGPKRSDAASQALAFFQSNRQLAQKLGVADNLDMPPTLSNVKVPTSKRRSFAEMTSYHQLHQNLGHIADLKPVREQAHAEAEAARNLGHWSKDDKGAAVWHEGQGVTAFHNAALKAAKADSEAEKTTAVKELTAAANALGSSHPMVKDYLARLSVGELPTNNDLAQWKSHSHAQYRDKANRLHVVEFADEQRTKKSTVSDLKKAFTECTNEYERLWGVFAA